MVRWTHPTFEGASKEVAETKGSYTDDFMKPMLEQVS